MLEFNPFSKELRTYLGYEFQDISFLMFLSCSLNAALVLHILLARRNKSFVHAICMGHCVRLWIWKSHSSLQILSKHINKDLSNLSNWLKANKSSLNIKKTELVLFIPKKLKLDHSFKFKIDGKRLTHIHSVKYLGVLLDEHMSWNE